jgi:hypothetical protein
LGSDGNGSLVSEIDSDALNIIARQIGFKNFEIGDRLSGDAAAAGFFPRYLWIKKGNGMASPGKKNRSPRSGRAGSNDGYMHEFVNIKTKSASMLPEEVMHD